MRISRGERIFNVINICFMLFLCVIMLYPYLHQIAIAFNDGADTAFGGITIFPRKFTIINIQTVLTNDLFNRAAMISVSRVIFVTILSLVVTTGAGYAISKNNLPGRKFFSTMLMIPAYISVGLIPSFILFRNLGLINSYFIYILPRMFIFYNMIIISSFMRALPRELDESAIIDGANEIQIFFKIIIPLSKPVLATVALWLAVENWNDWTTTLYYITDRNLYTLQYILMQVIKESETIQSIIADISTSGGNLAEMAHPTPESVKSATFIVTTVPIILAYPFLQKYFVKGVTLGAVKG